MSAIPLCTRTLVTSASLFSRVNFWVEDLGIKNATGLNLAVVCFVFFLMPAVAQCNQLNAMHATTKTRQWAVKHNNTLISAMMLSCRP